ncbi:MAG: hypothetical protein V3V39_04205, partial [Desulfobacterales bacterium]
PDQGFVVAPQTGLVMASQSLLAHDMVSLAWLLEARSTVPPKEKKVHRDPYTSQFIVNIANRWVVKLLGDIAQAASAEKLVRNDLEAIWDDRVLRHAFQLLGGIPQIKFIEANSKVPAALKKKLLNMTTFPG